MSKSSEQEIIEKLVKKSQEVMSNLVSALEAKQINAGRGYMRVAENLRDDLEKHLKSKEAISVKGDLDELIIRGSFMLDDMELPFSLDAYNTQGLFGSSCRETVHDDEFDFTSPAA
ncbi:MAG: hypothetical protein KDH94_01370 [Coxiellaceae bacterium]|nr:hypothetical protein [Coxiellaceae bacterium]